MITRKAYGGAYDVMGSKHLRADFNFAWPTRRGRRDGTRRRRQHRLPQGAREADDPDARRAELVDEYREQFANPFTAAERGYVDDVIAPRSTRPVLITALEASAGKRVDPPRRKHGNIPL